MICAYLLERVAERVHRRRPLAGRGIRHGLGDPAELGLQLLQDDSLSARDVAHLDHLLDLGLLDVGELDAGPAQRRDAELWVVQRLSDLERRALQVHAERGRDVQDRLGRLLEPDAPDVRERQQDRLHRQHRLVAEGGDALQVGRHLLQPLGGLLRDAPGRGERRLDLLDGVDLLVPGGDRLLGCEDQRRSDSDGDASAEVPDLRADLVELLPELADALACGVHVAGELGAGPLQLLGGGLDVAECLLAPLAELAKLLADLLRARERDPLRDGLRHRSSTLRCLM